MTDVSATAVHGLPVRARGALAIGLAATFALFAAVLSLAVGPIAIPPERVLSLLVHAALGGTGQGIDARDMIVILDIRLPRTVLAMIVGAGTAVGGAVMQGLFRNPLADPSLVGVSSGAALAAATWIVWGSGAVAALGTLGNLGLPVAAFAGGLIAAGILNGIATKGGRTSIIAMLLAGIALTGLGGALIGLIVFLSSDQQLREFTFWTLGSLGGATWLKTVLVLPFVLGLVGAAPMLARALDALTLGEAEAFHVGIHVERMKRLAVIAVAGAIGASVAVSGIIGFFGLTVPHIVRLICGPAHRLLLPVAALAGAGLLVIADVIARTAASPAEIPLGVITAAVGAPLMLWLLAEHRRSFFG